MRWHEKAMQSYDVGWSSYLSGLSQSLDDLDKDVDEANKMSENCNDEWCTAIEHVFDELSNALYSISEPSFISEDQSRHVKKLRMKLHDTYYKYRRVKEH